MPMSNEELTANIRAELILLNELLTARGNDAKDIVSRVFGINTDPVDIPNHNDKLGLYNALNGARKLLDAIK